MAVFVMLLVAAGASTRLGQGLPPKQYLKIQQREVLWHALANVCTPYICKTRVVVRQEHEILYRKALLSLSDSIVDTLLPPVYGGSRRQDSVRIGLESIEYINPDFVIIHDACRPFARAVPIHEVIDRLQSHVGTAQAVQAVDTIAAVSNEVILSSIPRESIKILQTPQIYRYKTLLECHRKVYQSNPERCFTDDSSLMLECGMSVTISDGDYNNFKITTIEDVYRAVMYAQLLSSVPHPE